MDAIEKFYEFLLLCRSVSLPISSCDRQYLNLLCVWDHGSRVKTSTTCFEVKQCWVWILMERFKNGLLDTLFSLSAISLFVKRVSSSAHFIEWLWGLSDTIYVQHLVWHIGSANWNKFYCSWYSVVGFPYRLNKPGFFLTRSLKVAQWFSCSP